MVVQGARRNGLQWPPGAFQVASWVVFVFFVATFYALEFLYTDTVGRAVAGAIYGVLAVVSFVAGSIATVEDPADRNIYEAEPKWAPREVVAGHLYCYRCERHVKDTSKHCTICQKCVDVFDHHCLWLSNCVGAHNYKPFLALLVCAAAQLLTQVGYGIYVIVQFGTSTGDFDRRVRQTYPVLDGAVFFGLTVAITALAIVALGLVVQLLSFHIYLIVHGLTTYDYIVNRAQGGTGSGGSASSRAGVSSTKRSSRARSGRGRSQSPQHHKSQAHHHGGLASPSRADPAIAAAAAAAAAEEGGAIASATTTVTGEGGAAASAAAPGAPEGTIAATTAAPDAVSVQLHPPPVTVIAAPSSPLRDLSSAPPPVPAIGDAAPGDGPGGGISVV